MQSDSIDSTKLNVDAGSAFIMTGQIWIGLSLFLIILAALFYILFGPKRKYEHLEYNIIKYLIALAGGFAAWFISGDSVIQISEEFEGFKFAVAGTLGFMIFILTVWKFPAYLQILPPGFKMKILSDWTFEEVAVEIVGGLEGNIIFSGFTRQQLNSKMKAAEMSYKNELEALQNLRKFSKSNIIPAYNVLEANGIYELTITS